MKVVVAAISLLTMAAFGVSEWCEVYAADSPALPGNALVIAVHATKGCFSDVVHVTGFLVPRTVAIVNADGDGYKITEILVSEGDQVMSGQDLARLVRSATKDTRAPGGATAARSATLHAPIAGLVMSSTAMVGAFASPQAGPMFRIIADNEIELEVEVPSQQVTKLKPGATVRINFDNGPERNGRVRLVDAEINQRTQLGRARLSVDKDPSFRVGIFASATIDASRSCGISVPRSSVNYQTQGTNVQVVRNGIIETRRVQIGLLSDDNVEIREGVSEGDTVVANAGTSLHDGDQVKTIFTEEIDKARVR
jgi:multidrug efflux pump subunit AcrA (membrane-fusion protein)